MKYILIILFCFLLSNKNFGQKNNQFKDPEITEMVNNISVDSIKSYVYKLTSFGTRHSCRYIKESSESYLKNFSATINMRPDRFQRGGDHKPFNQNGFTAVRFSEYNEDFTRQHQDIRKENNINYGDLPEFVNYNYVANVAKMNLITLASLAKAPGQPKKARMKVNLSNITYLSWEGPKTGPKPKGYYILLRETYQPLWEKKIFVSDLKVELPYSKDNYYFGIQAVEEDGHLSQIVVPAPEI